MVNYMSVRPRSTVAIILAVAVFFFVLLGSMRPYFMDTIVDDKVAVLWADLIKVIIGGLIGYMSHSGSDGHKGDRK